MADWQLRRKIESNSNEYYRITDPVGGVVPVAEEG